MPKTLEHRIRYRATSIYVVVIIVCGFLLFYLLSVKNSVDAQKGDLSEHLSTLALTNDLTMSVHQAQSEAKSYVTTGNQKYLDECRRHLKKVDQIIDSLEAAIPGHDGDAELREIKELLDEKMELVSVLHSSFDQGNPIDAMNEIIHSYDLSPRHDSIFIMVETKDSTVNLTPKKKFFKRLSEAFNPKKVKDSIVTISSSKAETLVVAKLDTVDLKSEVDSFARAASIDYIEHLRAIENQTVKLMAVDDEISSRIASLLLDLHSKALNSTMDDVVKSGQFLKRNYTYSIIGVALSMGVILLFIILIILDVNKGHSARVELEKANRKKAEVMESRHRLLLSISHDIKSPLGSIIGNLELGKSSGITPESISSMENSSKYILSLLQNLLDFSSLEKGSMELSESDFRLYDLCSETADMFRPIATLKGLQMDVTLDIDEHLTVHSDALKLKQIIGNLLSNAIKYTSKGTISLSASYRGSTLSLTISDTGAGIPQDKLSEIFKPFTRISENNKYAEGNGLGLFVVRGLVDLLQGTISVESKCLHQDTDAIATFQSTSPNESVPPHGTQVHIDLPLKQCPSPVPELVEGVEVLEATSEVPSTISPSPKQILVVDDYPPFLDMVVQMLTNMGHKPTPCGTMEEFESHLLVSPTPDYILTDMDMQSFSGTDILAKVAASAMSVPVIVMTAFENFSAEKAKDLGFSGYLKKPFTGEDLYFVFGGSKNTTVSQVFPLSSDSLQSNISSERTTSKSIYIPASLLDMFDGDEAEARKIMDIFIQSTGENIKLIEQAISADDYKQAQFLCHKMLPMSAQIGIDEIVPILRKMDSLRGTHPSAYPDWKTDIQTVLTWSASFLQESGR